jgi:hypothetical protein
VNLPGFLARPDPDYSQFSVEQVDALMTLGHQWATCGSDDLFWAGVPVMRDDGAMHIVPLTVSRVEFYAATYWTRHSSELFVLSPDR